MEIGEVLSKAWKIIWKHKILWLFGILSSCGSVGSYGSNSYSYSFNEFPSWLEDSLIRPDPEFWIGVSMALICLAFIWFALVILISVIGRASLVRGALQSELGADRLTFSELWRGSLPYFWRILGLTLIFYLGIFILVASLIAIATAMLVLTFGIALLCLIPLLCLLIPLFAFVYLLLDQSTNAIVIENVSAMDGLRKGWGVLRQNLGLYALMGLILYIGGYLIGGTIISLPISLATLPMIFGNALALDRGYGSSIAISVICLVLYLPVFLVLYGMLNSYISTGFTLTYLRLTTPGDSTAAPSTGLAEPAPENAPGDA